MKDSRADINGNFQAVASDFSGTTFPTANLFEGMTCYRSDQKKVYRYINTTGTTFVWKLEVDLNVDYDTIMRSTNKATQAEAEAGTDDKKFMTPLLVAKSIARNVVFATAEEAEAGTIENKAMNPKQVKASVLKNAPNPEIATSAEAEAGIDDTKMMTPKKVKQVVDVAPYVHNDNVGNAANKIPKYNASGHLVLPNGSEFWIG